MITQSNNIKMKNKNLYLSLIIILSCMGLVCSETTQINDNLVNTTGNLSIGYFISNLFSFNELFNITYTNGNLNTAGSITTSGAITGSTLDTGQGANELYAMDQDVETTDAVTFATVDTGNGASELYPQDQSTNTTSAPTFATVDTGQGANELYDMDQNVQTTDTVTFDGLTLSALTASRLTATSSGKVIESVASLTSWIAGTANQIIVTDDADGSITLSLPQDINTTSAATFVTVDTGQGANELYAMDQDVETTDAVTFATVDTGNGASELYPQDQSTNTTSAPTFATVDTGQGANELYDMDQNVQTTDAVTFATIDTGQGANELYDMDQNVQTTDTPQFSRIGLGQLADSNIISTILQITDNIAQFIDQDGNNISVFIDSESTTENIVDIDADTLTSGDALNIYSNSSSSSGRSLIELHNDNIGASNTKLLELIQDADKEAIRITAGTLTDQVIQVNGDSLTTGFLANFDSNSADSSTRILVEIKNDNAAATGTTAFKVQQDSTAPSIVTEGGYVGLDFPNPTEPLIVGSSSVEIFRVDDNGNVTAQNSIISSGLLSSEDIFISGDGKDINLRHPSGDGFNRIVFQTNDTDKVYVEYLDEDFGVAARANTFEFITASGTGANITFRPNDATAMHLKNNGEIEINSISGDGTGKAVCIKSTGDLGTCTDAVGAGGTCTCA